MNQQKETFIEKLKILVEQKELIRLLLSNKKNAASDLKNIIVTIVKLKNGYHLCFVYRHNTKDVTKNFSFIEGLNLIGKALDEDFYNADIYSNTENINFLSHSKGKAQLKYSKPTLQVSSGFSHDRAKERLIVSENNVYLRELGITNAQGEVRREMTDKFKQINRYIELLAPYLSDLPHSDKWNVVDMGAGKGYLTFALFDFLTCKKKLNAHMTGIEFREDLVNVCNTIAQKSGFDNLHFVQGTIEKAEINNIDVLIALHACDTATDEAIYRGITSNASLIVCAPCCHKQIRKEFDVTNVLSNVVRFGILKERQAEIVTDSLRAMIMEAYGYKTNVFEFISTEHTPKNVMIVGKKTNETPKNKKQILDNIASLKQMFGIKKHHLEILLNM